MIYDISPLISEDIAVWPGDTDFKRIMQLDICSGDNITLSGFQSTVHLGTHTDAPSHFVKGGKTIDACPLETYIGECQVIYCNINKATAILPEHLSTQVTAPRVLLRTNSFPNPNLWNTDFCYLSLELIQLLSKHNVKLIGIDTPSIDAFDSKDLLSHNALAQAKIAILEGIDLSKVAQGKYELIALPLKLHGFDASPVRAILRDLP